MGKAETFINQIEKPMDSLVTAATGADTFLDPADRRLFDDFAALIAGVGCVRRRAYVSAGTAE